MKIGTWLLGIAATGALACTGQAAQAALICAGCGYDNAAAGTYLGTYDPRSFDYGTFHHSDVGQISGANAPFEDFWVFDLDASGSGSVSADFTAFTGISGFTAELFADGGSTCAGSSCSSVVTGALLASDAAGGDSRWEIIAGSLPAGRYIIRVTGTTNGSLTSAYTGQLAFVSEPGTLALLGFGLLVLGVAHRRRA
jgi:hypothetical protein